MGLPGMVLRGIATVAGATGNDHLETEGVADRKKDDLKPAGEKVKDAFKKR